MSTSPSAESRTDDRRDHRKIETILRNQRALVAVGLVVLCGLAWVYLVTEARSMSAMAGLAETGGLEGAWGLRHLGYLFVMWSVMMVAMMLPSAAPMILLFARIDRKRRDVGGTTALFVLGYLLVWTAYSVVAATGQWALHHALLVSPGMVSLSPALSGGLLVAAGAFQFTRLKNLCVHHCRSPLSFLTSHWKEGRRGAVEMGLHHGTYCVGCCWALMALLFVLGVMNLIWVTALAAFVLVEKTVQGGQRVTRLAGAALVVWGSWLLIDAGRSALGG